MTTTFVGRAGTFFGGRLDDPPVSESQPHEVDPPDRGQRGAVTIRFFRRARTLFGGHFDDPATSESRPHGADPQETEHSGRQRR